MLKKSNQNENWNLYREIQIRLFLIAQLLNNEAIKDKETMNSSNYTLVTYLSDIVWKFILCHLCIVLANLS